MNTFTASTVLSVGRSLKSTHVNPAYNVTPGVPPSCTLSFITLNGSFVDKSVVITDHAAQYANNYYDSVFDDSNNILPSLVCDAATLLYRTIYAIGTGNSSLNDLQKLNVDCTLVEKLVNCVTLNITCQEVLKVMPSLHINQVDEWPVHYVGVWKGAGLSQHQKFIHDWVYNKSAFSRGNNSCSGLSDCSGDQQCIGGVCQLSTTYLHPAFPLNVELVIGDFSSYWKVIDFSSSEPLWTESNWKPLSLRLFLMGDPLQDYIFLGIAITEVIIVIVTVIFVRRNFEANFRVL